MGILQNSRPSGSSDIDRSSLRYKQTVALAMIAVLLVLLFIFLFVIIIVSVNTDDTTHGGDENETTQIDDHDLEYTSMTVSHPDTQKGTLVLVNSTHEYAFPEKNNLINIYDYRATHSSASASHPYQLSSRALELDREALDAMHKMLTKFSIESGKTSLNITSAYRTYEEQLALNSSTKAGFSDSHTGLSFSLAVYENDISSQINSDYNKAIYYDWLVAHAHEYGFILRYPDNKAQITGVTNYARAFRYVGIAHATYMYSNDLCLEEYIELLKTDSSFDSPIRVLGADGKSYIIYYTALEGDSTDIKVPVTIPNPDGSPSTPYTVSGTNDGGVVVTVCLG